MQLWSRIFLPVFLCCLLSSLLAQNPEPKRQELDSAAYRLKIFEEKVLRAKGKPFSLNNTEKEALAKIRQLREKYPGHPRVEEMFERASKALMTSKGEMFDVTPEMRSFRDKGKKLIDVFHKIGAEEWKKVHEEYAAKEHTITAPFPQANPMESNVEEYTGRWIFLSGVQYPQNEFTMNGNQWLSVGNPATGYYYVRLSSREWKGGYAALKRYCREVGGSIPQEVEWFVLGQIDGVSLLVPEAGEQKMMDAQFGWTVKPQFIYVPGYVLAKANDNENGGTFTGEDRLEQLKNFMYSVNEIPTDVSPQKLAEIYITAIKERNYKLWSKCLDPERLKTPRATALANYHWDWHLTRWNTQYIDAKIEGEPQIRVIRGDDTTQDEEYFLNKEQREKLQKHAQPSVKEATIILRLIDDNGRQFRAPQKFYLIKYQDGPWYVEFPWLPN